MVTLLLHFERLTNHHTHTTLLHICIWELDREIRTLFVERKWEHTVQNGTHNTGQGKIKMASLFLALDIRTWGVSLLPRKACSLARFGLVHPHDLSFASPLSFRLPFHPATAIHEYLDLGLLLFPGTVPV